ncbi:Dyp-type peroxidase [Corynebacterium sp. YSMAA1_1_F7]|uniref:Dyp-type peroxidase n=1 Tax=Corynebacterium sp. YSMAA1_1_F7 TaxID=3383590 RepID=UPI0038CF87F3
MPDPVRSVSIPMDAPVPGPTGDPTFTRRGFFAGLGMTGAASVLAACSTAEDSAASDGQGDADDGASIRTISFDGVHQAGIQEDSQTHALVVAFNMKRNNVPKGGLKKNLTRLMRIWTGDARSMTQGETALADLEPELTVAPQNLTITMGWGPRLIKDVDLIDEAPAWVKKNLNGLPKFKGDKLDNAFGAADVVLQICGDSLTAVSHAARVLTRGGRDYATPKWTQRGFVDSPTGETPRNLLGFKDGTAIPRTDAEYDEAIWDDQGGSAMVVRRIVFDMPGWEKLDRKSREVVFGRHVDTGAPLGGKDEFDPVDLNKSGEDGLPLIDERSHVGISVGEGSRIRRRAYNWDNEVTPLGNSGLIFICFQNDPDEAFTPLQKRLAEKDRLNTWITHVGSAVFWVLPGTQNGAHWGQQFLEG